jgi:hypothetical protein
MPGTTVRFTDMQGIKGKVVYICVNGDPPNVDADMMSDLSGLPEMNASEMYFADVRVFDNSNELSEYVTDIIICDEVCPAEVNCFYGILYSGEEFPLEDCGIKSPEVVMTFSTGINSDDEDIALVNEYPVYDGRRIADFIEEYIQEANNNNNNAGVYVYSEEDRIALEPDDFFIFAGNIKHINCVVEE